MLPVPVTDAVPNRRRHDLHVDGRKLHSRLAIHSGGHVRGREHRRRPSATGWRRAGPTRHHSLPCRGRDALPPRRDRRDARRRADARNRRSPIQPPTQHASTPRPTPFTGIHGPAPRRARTTVSTPVTRACHRAAGAILPCPGHPRMSSHQPSPGDPPQPSVLTRPLANAALGVAIQIWAVPQEKLWLVVVFMPLTVSSRSSPGASGAREPPASWCCSRRRDARREGAAGSPPRTGLPRRWCRAATPR